MPDQQARVTPSASPVASGAPTTAPSWTGVVSAVTDQTLGFTANCNQLNFNNYNCIPVTTKGATIVGTATVGGYFEVWGTVAPPNVTATYVVFSATPFPSPGPTTSPAATATGGAVSGAPATAPSWTGIVSAVSDQTTAFTANCGQLNFSNYGCIPVTTKGATIVGTATVGGYFEVWGTVAPPNVTATYVIFSATPFPSPGPTTSPTATPIGGAAAPHLTPAPAPTPTAHPATIATPTPIPTPPPPLPPSGSTFMALTNAAEYPAGFPVPYAASSIWNRTVSANPTIASYSANVVSHQFPSGIDMVLRSNEAGPWDNTHTRFFATASDPLVNVACNQYCGAPDNGGAPATMRIPAVARPTGGTDAMFSVVQPDGTEIDMWAAYGSPGSNTSWNAPHNMQTRNWQTGDTITAGNVVNCGNYASSIGFVASGPGATAAGYCQGGGQVTAAELISGHINHALTVTGECAIGNQYPSQNGASTQQCTSGVGPPLGGREWYDVPCATTQATSLRPWEKAILCALNQYGAYFGDNGNGGAYFTGGLAAELESEEPWRDYNGSGTNKASYTSQFAALASQGWSAIGISSAIGSSTGMRWIGADPWNVWTELGESEAQFASHIHWLDPCSARGAC